jgi:hypothetical protein
VTKCNQKASCGYPASHKLGGKLFPGESLRCAATVTASHVALNGGIPADDDHGS